MLARPGDHPTTCYFIVHKSRMLEHFKRDGDNQERDGGRDGHDQGRGGGRDTIKDSKGGEMVVEF